MKEENISLFYCRIGIHHVSELRCALGVYVCVCVCVCVHVCVGFKYSSLHKAALHGLPVCSQIERGLEDFRSILAVAKLFRKHQHRPLTLSLTYQVCYFDMNVSDLKKKKVLPWKRSTDCGRRSTAVVKRHISQKRGYRFAKSEKRSMEWEEPD